jgi:hypothetical protein
VRQLQGLRRHDARCVIANRRIHLDVVDRRWQQGNVVAGRVTRRLRHAFRGVAAHEHNLGARYAGTDVTQHCATEHNQSGFPALRPSRKKPTQRRARHSPPTLCATPKTTQPHVRASCRPPSRSPTLRAHTRARMQHVARAQIGSGKIQVARSKRAALQQPLRDVEVDHETDHPRRRPRLRRPVRSW